jgi:hypothetical protein
MQLGHNQQSFVQSVREALKKHQAELEEINQKVSDYL